MNRNEEFRFDLAPHETMHRSKFNMPADVLTTWNMGDLVPIYVNADILPGDTFSVKTQELIRVHTMLDPIFSNIECETFWFFVPHRIVWTHFLEFMGQNNDTPWYQETEYTVPQITAPTGGWRVNSLADYFGIPTGIDGFSVNALPFRSYAAICSTWFRRQAVTYPVDYTLDDTTITGSNGTDQVTDIVKGGCCFRSARAYDLFSASLPSPQCGPDQVLPLGNLAPVIGGKVNNLSPGFTQDNTFTGKQVAIRGDSSNTIVTDATTPTGITGGTETSLYTDMSKVTGTSVNQLRIAFQLQKMAERTARSGNKYIEIVAAAFGTISPDARMQRPEYLGGHKITLNIHSVTQTSASPSGEGTSGTSQGHQTAYSVTYGENGDFSKSFTEHGTLMCIMRCRNPHPTYSQGLHRQWTRKTKAEFYDPILANIGEQKIRLDQLYLQGTDDDSTVFGYNEAWSEYRFTPSLCTGEMRPQAPTSLASWHLGDYYSSAPSLSDTWMRVDKAPLDRCLAVTSSVANQFFGEFHFDITATRVMPTFSVPGLIDHH